ITERKRAEEALQRSELHLRAIFDSSHDAIVTLDSERVITSANPAFFKTFGYEPSEVIGRSVELLHLSQESFVEFGRKAYSTLQQTGSWRGEWQYKKSDGTVFPIESHMSTLNIPSDKLIGYVSIMRDITERKHNEEKREKLLAELEEALSKVKQLSGMLPICSNCKNIRDDQGYWQRIEAYIADHSDALFSHGICPDCMKELYPEWYGEIVAQDPDLLGKK
ncbi:MAG: PAS domain S-box protein, partial [Proteobacteria bacterium]|nr:PAS domain S-box protein [Pseudomonadota bacterium]